MKKIVIFAISLLSLTGVMLAQPAMAATNPVTSATQYMNGWQIVDGQLSASQLTIKAPAGHMTYDQGWTIYNNSVNDGNDRDLEFMLQKNFSATDTQKRYCVQAIDLAPYGVTAKLQLWTGEYTIVPGYPYGLETSPQAFVPTTTFSKTQYDKVCNAWSPIQGTPTSTNQRLAIVGETVVTQGAVKLSSVSIEAR